MSGWRLWCRGRGVSHNHVCTSHRGPQGTGGCRKHRPRKKPEPVVWRDQHGKPLIPVILATTGASQGLCRTPPEGPRGAHLTAVAPGVCLCVCLWSVNKTLVSYEQFITQSGRPCNSRASPPSLGTCQVTPEPSASWLEPRHLLPRATRKALTLPWRGGTALSRRGWLLLKQNESAA